MKKPTQIFSTEERDEIKKGIASAEAGTSGEIVPVVVSASGRYDRSEDIFGIIFALIIISIYWSMFQLPIASEWSTASSGNPVFWPVILIFIISFIIGATLASTIPVLRLPFIAKSEMQQEVERSAIETFQRQRIRATKEGTGVLIYLSLFEHMVHVVGDDGINAKVEPGEWQSICDLIVKGMRENKPEPALLEAIKSTGLLLAKYFPIADDDQNELDNDLILID